MNNNQFSRFELLIGKDNFNKIKDLKVLVIGLGGVGSYVVEGLVRSGVSNLILVDYDKIDITNLNRQIMANLNNIGKNKTDILFERIKSINSFCDVKIVNQFIDKDNLDNLFNNSIDYVIDCCDTVETKKLIIKKCLDNNIKFITCMGTGKRLDPSKLQIIDIRKTSYDPLAKKIRKWVNDERLKGKIMCCCSLEKAISVDTNIIPSAIFVPASAGLLISSYVIRDVIDYEK